MQCTSCEKDTVLYGYNLQCKDCLGDSAYSPEYIRKHPLKAFVSHPASSLSNIDNFTRPNIQIRPGSALDTLLDIELSVQTPLGFCKCNIELFRMYDYDNGNFDSRITNVDPIIFLAFPELVALTCRTLDIADTCEYLMQLQAEEVLSEFQFDRQPYPKLLSAKFIQQYCFVRAGSFYTLEHYKPKQIASHYTPLKEYTNPDVDTYEKVRETALLAKKLGYKQITMDADLALELINKKTNK